MFWTKKVPDALPPFESEKDLVLPSSGSKGHYHVTGVTYEGVARDGKTLTWSAGFDLTGNDVLAVAEIARRTAHARRVHINGFRVCTEKH